MISHDQIKTILSYDKLTGQFVWLVKKSAQIACGALAGTTDNKGYINISIDRKRYKAHRLAWFYVHGVWPTYQIDHINRNKSDNRIANLRDVTQSENQHNKIEQRSDARHSRFLGVSRRVKKTGYISYVAEISHNKKRIYLGHFTSEEDAGNAYIKAKNNLEPKPPIAAPDKALIKADLQAGKEVPGACLTQSLKLVVK